MNISAMPCPRQLVPVKEETMEFYDGQTVQMPPPPPPTSPWPQAGSWAQWPIYQRLYILWAPNAVNNYHLGMGYRIFGDGLFLGLSHCSFLKPRFTGGIWKENYILSFPSSRRNSLRFVADYPL